MKIKALLLLAGAITLSAVEWEAEQIDKQPGVVSVYSTIAFDPQGAPRVAFFGGNINDEMPSLKVASKATGSWVIKDVSELYGPSYVFSLDVDSEGNNYVAYVDTDTMTYAYSLFLASDSSGDFVSKKLSGDDVECASPVVKIGPDGKIHLAYVEYNYDNETTELRYGWFDGSSFNSEVITEGATLMEYDLSCNDLVLVDGVPHVFYMDTNYIIQHAARSSAYSASWNIEPISDTYSINPSAGVDAEGNLCVGYRMGYSLDSIMYTTNKNGSWQKQLIAQTDEPEEIMFIFLSLALDPQGAPHIIWCDYDENGQYDIFYARRTPVEWNQEYVTNTPEEWEFPLFNHFFGIDNAGYGHLTYTMMNADDEIPYVYYAKSKTPLVTGIAENPPQATPFELAVVGSEVRFSLPQAGDIRIDLYDASGRRVVNLASGSYSPGEHSIPLSTAGLAAGVYFVRAEDKGLSASAKFIVTH